jgi:hypothetical protein
MRAIFALLTAGLAVVPAGLQAKSNTEALPRERAMFSSTQTLSFDPRGVIRLEQSFGDVEIQGWDRPEVEITTIRSTDKRDTVPEWLEAKKELDSIAVTALKQGEDELTITTDFPGRRLVRNLPGKNDADLKYVIKAPLHAKLVVHHDIGQVLVSNFASDIEVTARVGEIGLNLAEPELYAVDARARIGDVCSDFASSEGRELTGQQLHTDVTGWRRQLFLRVGIGDISIKKMKW